MKKHLYTYIPVSERTSVQGQKKFRPLNRLTFMAEKPAASEQASVQDQKKLRLHDQPAAIKPVSRPEYPFVTVEKFVMPSVS
jgi:hypothetical protein